MSDAYGPNWVNVNLMIYPSTMEIHAVGGDREEGQGDTKYIGLELIKSQIQSLKQELDQLYNALKDPWCRISAERVPEGYFRLDATVSDKELVIFGIADENHNCDEMGCGTLDHVIYRIPIPPSPDITKGE